MTVLYTLDQLEDTPCVNIRTPDDGNLGVPKHVGEETVYQMCYFSGHGKFVRYVKFCVTHGTLVSTKIHRPEIF